MCVCACVYVCVHMCGVWVHMYVVRASVCCMRACAGYACMVAVYCTYQVEGDVYWVLLKNWREALCLPHLSREDHVRWVNTVW